MLSPALAGRFVTTEPSRKPLVLLLIIFTHEIRTGSRDHTRSYSENSSVLFFSNASLITISVRKLWKRYCFQMATDMVI